MEFTTIPNLDLKVGRIGLGSWAMGGSLWGGTDERAAIDAVHQALDKGINLIDTAPAYGHGESERIVGKALKKYGKRDKIIIATKCGLNQETEGKVFRDSRRDSILKEVETSLKNLQTDYIDLYQIHWPDSKTPIAETAETMKELLNNGKIRSIGVSNYSIEQMEEFRRFSPLHTSQFDFNLFERDNEKTLLKYCLKAGLATLGYSAICRGMLSGEMSEEREFKGDDLRKGMDPKFKEPQFSEYIAAAKALKKWAQEKYHRPLIALAMRWNIDKGINIPLWGARRPDQLAEVDQVFGWKLTDADFKEIDKIIAENVKNPVGVEFMAPPEREFD